MTQVLLCNTFPITLVIAMNLRISSGVVCKKCPVFGFSNPCIHIIVNTLFKIINRYPISMVLHISCVFFNIIIHILCYDLCSKSLTLRPRQLFILFWRFGITSTTNISTFWTPRCLLHLSEVLLCDNYLYLSSWAAISWDTVLIVLEPEKDHSLAALTLKLSYYQHEYQHYW